MCKTSHDQGTYSEQRLAPRRHRHSACDCSGLLNAEFNKRQIWLMFNFLSSYELMKTGNMKMREGLDTIEGIHIVTVIFSVIVSESNYGCLIANIAQFSQSYAFHMVGGSAQSCWKASLPRSSAIIEVKGGVKCEPEVCVCVQSGHASGLPQAWSLSLIDPAPTCTSCCRPASVIDSQSGPWRWEAWPGLTEPGASQCVTPEVAGGEGRSQFPGPLTQVEEPISGEAFTAGRRTAGPHSLQEKIKATSAAAATVILRCGGK